MTIAQLQSLVDRWINTTGGGYFSHLTNMAILAEETGEVGRVIARLYGEQRPKPGEDVSADRLADELADLIWVATALANQSGIDLEKAIEKNLEKKNLRDCNRFTP